MADAHAKNHDFHIVDPSPWPFVGSLSAFILAVGAIMSMKGLAIGGMKAGPVLLGLGFIGVIYTMIAWWSDVVNESTHKGNHTRVVQLHHRYGMIMFIASEVMFFVACSGLSSTRAFMRVRKRHSSVMHSPAVTGRPLVSRCSTHGICLC